MKYQLGLLASIAAALAMILLNPAGRATEKLLLLDTTDDRVTARVRCHGTRVRRLPDTGSHSPWLQVKFLPIGRWPTADLDFPRPMNWTRATYVSFWVENPGPHGITVGFNVRDTHGKAYQRVRHLPPNRPMEVRVPIRDLASGKDRLGGWCGDAVDLASIKGITFQGHKPTTPLRLRVRVVMLVKADPFPAPAGLLAENAGDGVALRWSPMPNAISYDIARAESEGAFVRLCRFPTTRFVDVSARQGRAYRYRVRAVSDSGDPGDWTNPVTGTRTPGAAEALPPLDRFGGRSDINLGARGFFRIDRFRGRWTLVTPDGHPFYSIGICVVGCGDSYTRVTGREKLFDDIIAEKDDPKFKSAWTPWYGFPAYGLDDSGLVVSRYVRGLIVKYGAEWIEPWHKETIRRLRRWRVNSLGAWSHGELVKKHLLPYVSFAAAWGQCPTIPGAGVPDVFDDAFAREVDAAAARAVGATDDPWLIGWFTANEMGWYGDWRHGCSLVCLIQKAPADFAARKAWIAFLDQRYGQDIAALNRGWKTRFKTFDDLSGWRKKLPETSEARRDASAFLQQFAERYFGVTTKAILRYDPHHLILGARHSQSSSPEVLAANGRSCDVLSATLYGPSPRGELIKALAYTEKPWIVGEFHFQARDAGLPLRNVDATLPNQAARGDAYQDYLSDALSLPNLVGVHWFEYVDEPATGRFNHGKDGGEASNIGWVNVDDRPYRDFVSRAALINANVPLIFDSSLPPVQRVP